MKKIVILLLAAIAVTSCSNEAEYADQMDQTIKECEQHLDYLDSTMPFMDTVGESDSYYYLCKSWEEFQDAKANLDTDGMRSALDKYMKYYKECIHQAAEIKAHIDE